jgi:hypothetical protein
MIGIILDGLIKVGTFTVSNDIFKNIEISNGYFDVLGRKTNKSLHFLEVNQSADKYIVVNDFGKGILTSPHSIFIGAQNTNITDARLVKMVKANDN